MISLSILELVSSAMRGFLLNNPSPKNISLLSEFIEKWIKEIYSPINRLISQIIKPLNNEIKKLSADPYDDELMEIFCSYIILSQKKIEKVEKIYNIQYE